LVDKNDHDEQLEMPWTILLAIAELRRLCHVCSIIFIRPVCIQSDNMPIPVDLKRAAWAAIAALLAYSAAVGAEIPPNPPFSKGGEIPSIPPSAQGSALVASAATPAVENSATVATPPLEKKGLGWISIPALLRQFPRTAPALPSLAPTAATATAAQLLPPAALTAPPPPLWARTSPEQQTLRLHDGLLWDVCGARPGAAPINPQVQFTDAKHQPLDISANRIDGDQNTGIVQLQGDIELRQTDRRLEAEWARYDRRSGQIDAAGALFLDTPGLRLTGDAAAYNLNTQQGSIEHAQYRLSGAANVRGEAERAWLLPNQVSRYQNIVYTTCPPGQADWSLKASALEIDQSSGMGTARHARIRLGDIPILYSPYLSFPIDGRRRSGWLIPSFGSSDETGTDITLPYYLNLAPNMDATLTPRFMSARGLMLGAQLRYLNPLQELEINAEVLPHDQRDAAQGLRDAVRIKQRGQFGARWASAIDYAAVSDDQYLQDFGNRLDITSVRNLSRRADLNYAGNGWHLLTRMQEFQTVDTSIAPADRPYGQLPHIELKLDPARWRSGWEYRIDSQYDYFDHTTAVHGSRLVTVPSIRFPLRRSAGYFIPRLRVFHTEYNLVDQNIDWAQQPSHIIPSADVDTKLIFERQINWFGNATMQTLEPRVYYVHTAYADQAENPRFDTTALDFSFASLFRANRFTGYDRISDENRLTVGMTSRTITDQSGAELFRASLGQVFYFAERRVQLNADEREDAQISSIAGELAAQLSRNWSTVISAQWNPNRSINTAPQLVLNTAETERSWEKQIVQLRYAPDADHLLNIAYRYNLGTQNAERYEDMDLAFQVPLGSRVKLIGRWLYSMLNDETVEAFAGLEFGRCCWRLRLLGQHLKRDADTPGNTSVMLQLELAGLGSFGNRIDQLLERGIYGYHAD
jgi:LPS-assembly protein